MRRSGWWDRSGWRSWCDRCVRSVHVRREHMVYMFGEIYCIANKKDRVFCESSYSHTVWPEGPEGVCGCLSCIMLHASDGLRVGAPSALSARAEVTSVKPHSPLEDITVLVEHHFTREKGGG